STTNDAQTWEDFDLQDEIPTPGTTTSNNGQTTTTTNVTINDVFIRLQDIRLTPNSSQAMTNCQVRVEAWIDSQNRWTPAVLVTINSVNDMNPDPVIPSAPADVTAWNAINWTWADMSNDNLQVRLTWLEGTGCGNGSVNRGVELDALEARATWSSNT